MSGLPIDKIKVSTRLAMDYFEKNNHLFRSMKIKDDSELQEKRFSDGYNSIIPLKSVIQPSFIEETSESSSSMDCKLMKLKKEIEKNAGTFSEIEYLIRKIPVNEVKNYDIELIIKNLSFNASGSFTFPISRNCILMEKATPLADLGFVAQILKSGATAYIFADYSTAAACHLFTSLCHEVGLTSVKLVFWEERPEIAYVNTSYSQSGCVGVITENADMDSAVDVLLETTVQYPWKLTHILVQESVYSSFKKALQWKTRNYTCVSSKKKMCTEAFNYKEKTFLMDYAGTECGQEICVEAYRTTKELLSLLKKSEFCYMSLWTNNLNDSSEISHYDLAPNVIWINEYGSFDGPPESSQAVYTNILINNKMYETCKSAFPPKYDVLDNIEISFLEKQKKWLQLSYSKRFDIIYDCLCNVRNLLKDEEKEKILETLKKELKNCQVFMSVGNGKICEYSLKPIENICAVTVPVNYSTIVNELLIGTPMIVKYDNGDLFPALDKAGAPIVFISKKNFPNVPIMRLHDKVVSNFKVIYSNYGSIFAN